MSKRCDKAGGVAYTELLTVLRADRKGSYSTAVLIDYHDDSGRHTLRWPWAMAMCGPDVKPIELCDLGSG